MIRRILAAFAALFVSFHMAAAQQHDAAELAELIRGLGVNTRVLVIGAHPDDEDTQLITWLARGRNVETAYLSLTRGDGGQNLIGNELGEALGVIRTEELLAARRIDGGHQYFTRTTLTTSRRIESLGQCLYVSSALFENPKSYARVKY